MNNKFLRWCIPVVKVHNFYILSGCFYMYVFNLGCKLK
nr:MAG TPA: hypothetical protein [Caudoviricetes sp.]